MLFENFFFKLKTAVPLVSESSAKSLFVFMQMLLEKNKVMNLTAITDEDDFIKKHFVDSLSLATLNICQISSGLSNIKIIDVGTGAGFPGIPLAIVLCDKNIHFMLCDSLQKRINFLSEVVTALNLANVDLIHSRAEDLAHDKNFREQFDISIARAVASLPTLCEICMPFVKTNGSFIAYKMDDCNEEINLSANAIKTLGGDTNVKISSYCIGDDDANKNRALVEIKKISETPSKYPRKPNDIKKKPL